MPKSNMTGYLYLLIAATLWGLVGILAKFAFDAGVSSYEVAFWRTCFGGICFVTHALLTNRVEIKNPKNIYFAMFGAISLASFFTLYPMAIEAGGAALAVILLYTAPVWVAIFSKIFFKEKFNSGKITAICVGVFGVILVSVSSSNVEIFSSKAIFLGLLAGFFYATYYPFLTFFKNTDPIRIYAIAVPVATLIIFFLVPEFVTKDLFTWFILLLLGVLTTYFSLLTYGKGIHIVGPVPAVMICNLEPVVGTILAYLVWNESFTFVGLIGAFLVISAVFILAVFNRN